MTGCLPADCVWIRRRQKWCGLVHVDRLAASILVTFLCCQQTVKVAESARDLGVILDAELTMSALDCSCHCTLSIRILSTQTVTSIHPVTHYGSFAKTLVQAFISCRLDHCNSLLYGVTDNVTRRVQSLQNAAARLIAGARRRNQWSNYEGARGGLAPLKDRVAPSKHLVWEGTGGPLKGPLKSPDKFSTW